MDFSIKLDIVHQSGWSVVYTEGSQVTISKKKYHLFTFSEDHFCLQQNSADPVKCRVSYGNSLIVKVPVYGYLVYKGLTNENTCDIHIICYPTPFIWASTRENLYLGLANNKNADQRIRAVCSAPVLLAY